jgi:sterol desaturase/sphingolipid hydroxylase (fatty acid hydroxylase superfamily)
VEHLGAIAAYFNLKTLLILALAFIPLERLFGVRREQKILRKNVSVDLVYYFAIDQITRLIFIGLFAIAIAGTQAVMPARILATVQAQPIWLQFAEALLLFDTGIYLAHRSFHAVPLLWRFHAVHHSSEELDWMSAFRNHPVDLLVTRLVSMLPVFTLGFSADAIIALLVFQQGHAALVHANIKSDFGPLNRWIVSPHFHHWHHADHRSAYDRNFAGHLAFLDWIGGTLHLPGKNYPEKYGVDAAPPPGNPLRQLLDPFLPSLPPREAPPPAVPAE